MIESCPRGVCFVAGARTVVVTNPPAAEAKLERVVERVADFVCILAS